VIGWEEGQQLDLKDYKKKKKRSFLRAARGAHHVLETTILEITILGIHEIGRRATIFSFVNLHGRNTVNDLLVHSDLLKFSSIPLSHSLLMLIKFAVNPFTSRTLSSLGNPSLIKLPKPTIFSLAPSPKVT